MAKHYEHRDRGDVAQLVREARIRAGLTQQEMAERAGVSLSVIRAYEAGDRNPSFPALKKALAPTGYEPRLTLVHPNDREVPDHEAVIRAVVAALEPALPRRRA